MRAASACILPGEENDALMPTTIPRAARRLAGHPSTPATRPVHQALARRGRLEVPDLELLLDALGDREDRAGSTERARLHRIRGTLELDLADRLTE